MRIKDIATTATVICGGDIDQPGKYCVSVDALVIANIAATNTNVDLYACSQLVSADDAVNKFLDSFEIPAGDTLDVFEGAKFKLYGGETIQAKADNANYLRSFSFEEVKHETI